MHVRCTPDARRMHTRCTPDAFQVHDDANSNHRRIRKCCRPVKGGVASLPDRCQMGFIWVSDGCQMGVRCVPDAYLVHHVQLMIGMIGSYDHI